MCIACRSVKEKSELVRIAKIGDKIAVDKTGKNGGRGAYVCKSKECFNKLKKGKILNRAFSCGVDSSVYDEILESFFGKQE